MSKKIVVENILTPHIKYLKESGYDVYTLYKNSNLNEITSPEYKAIIVSGLDNLATDGASYNRPSAPIIEAKGQSPEEIYNLLESRFS